MSTPKKKNKRKNPWTTRSKNQLNILNTPKKVLETRALNQAEKAFYKAQKELNRAKNVFEIRVLNQNQNQMQKVLNQVKDLKIDEWNSSEILESKEAITLIHKLFDQPQLEKEKTPNFLEMIQKINIVIKSIDDLLKNIKDLSQEKPEKDISQNKLENK